MSENNHIIETRVAYLSKYSEDTILLKFKNDVMVTVEDAKEIDAAALKAFPGDYYYIIDVLSLTSNMSPSGLAYFSKQSQISKKTLAAAIVLNNLPIRITASAFVTFYKPVFMTKIFKDYESAEKWIDNLNLKAG